MAMTNLQCELVWKLQQVLKEDKINDTFGFTLEEQGRTGQDGMKLSE
jgi:hypothetical protein